MASFSFAVKDELSGSVTDRDKKYACLYGMLLFSRRFDEKQTVFRTEHHKAAELFCLLCGDVLGESGVVSCERREKKSSETYILTIDRPEALKKLAAVYRINGADDGYNRINADNIDTNSLPVFLMGAFLACGSIIDPNKSYHLEYAARCESLASDLSEMLLLVGVKAKILERKGDYVVYIKESEQIEDILTFMGATSSSLEIMNVKILKDIRNKANRIANCDSANIEKTVAASVRQIEEIELIERTVGLSSLSDELREAAELRLENPELSLRELGQMFSVPLGRSGVNHRFKRLSAIAEEISGGKN